MLPPRRVSGGKRVKSPVTSPSGILALPPATAAYIPVPPSSLCLSAPSDPSRHRATEDSFGFGVGGRRSPSLVRFRRASAATGYQEEVSGLAVTMTKKELGIEEEIASSRLILVLLAGKVKNNRNI
jgi:hypothetical protein